MEQPPENCLDFLRGIKDDHNFDGVGFDHSILSEDIGDIPNNRLPNWKGTSINWDLPSGGALQQLYEQLNKHGEIKFRFGAIRIPRSKLEELAKRHKNQITYEIIEESGNIFHGHILFDNKMEKPRQQTICTRLVDAAIYIHRRDETSE